MDSPNILVKEYVQKTVMLQTNEAGKIVPVPTGELRCKVALLGRSLNNCVEVLFPDGEEGFVDRSLIHDIQPSSTAT